MRRHVPAGTTSTRVLLVSVVVYAVLVIIWEPTNREFWIQTYVFATIWCLRQIIPLRARGLIGVRALVACLFTVNFFAALYPLSDPRTDYWRVYNAEAIERRGEVDLIVTSCTWLCSWYLRYFAGAQGVSPAEVDPETLRAAVAQVGSDRVLISSLAYAPHRLASVHHPTISSQSGRKPFAPLSRRRGPCRRATTGRNSMVWKTVRLCRCDRHGASAWSCRHRSGP